MLHCEHRMRHGRASRARPAVRAAIIVFVATESEMTRTVLATYSEAAKGPELSRDCLNPAKFQGQKS